MGIRIPGGRWGRRFALRRRMAALRSRGSVCAIERDDDTLARRPGNRVRRQQEEEKTKGESSAAYRFHVHPLPATTTQHLTHRQYQRYRPTFAQPFTGTTWPATDWAALVVGRCRQVRLGAAASLHLRQHPVVAFRRRCPASTRWRPLAAAAPASTRWRPLAAAAPASPGWPLAAAPRQHPEADVDRLRHRRQAVDGSRRPESRYGGRASWRSVAGARRVPRSRRVAARAVAWPRSRNPVAALRIPGSPHVVVIPIVAHEKSRNANTEQGPVIDQGHVSALVG